MTLTLCLPWLSLPSQCDPCLLKTTEQSYKAGTYQEEMGPRANQAGRERDTLYIWSRGTETRIGTRLVKAFHPFLNSIFSL